MRPVLAVQAALEQAHQARLDRGCFSPMEQPLQALPPLLPPQLRQVVVDWLMRAI